MKIVEFDQNVSRVLSVQELNFAQKWYHLNKAGYKNKLDTLVAHELTQVNIMEQIIVCESQKNRPRYF